MPTHIPIPKRKYILENKYIFGEEKGKMWNVRAKCSPKVNSHEPFPTCSFVLNFFSSFSIVLSFYLGFSFINCITFFSPSRNLYCKWHSNLKRYFCRRNVVLWVLKVLGNYISISFLFLCFVSWDDSESLMDCSVITIRFFV